MRAAVAAGASLINDVRALEAPGALEAAAATGAAVCLMHMQGEPEHDAGRSALRGRGRRGAPLTSPRGSRPAAAAGIGAGRICVDPGIGFGKRPEHNLALLAALDRLADPAIPVLVGVSRKSLVGIITGRPAGERLAGSVALRRPAP